MEVSYETCASSLFMLFLLSYTEQLFCQKTLGSCHSEERYIALTKIKSRLGNQLYQLAAGYGIAQKAQRTYYYVLGGNSITERRVRNYLRRIAETFPKTLRMYKIFKTNEIKQMKIIFAPGERFKRCCLYEDPARFIDHPAKYIQLSQGGAQNALYLEDYLPEIRQFFQFSEIARKRGEADLGALQMGRYILSTTFFDAHKHCDVQSWRASEVPVGICSEDTLYPFTEQIWKGLHHIILFGDDQDFMDSLARILMANNSSRTVHISTYTEMSDFYISSRLCKSFLLSAPTSTMGWWLAFFTKNQNSVYYYKDRRNVEDYKMLTDEFYLKAWHRLNG
ncbi:unnamed protein product [Cylicocyclus nassatus]|uniref:Uncharacterized protein n=1 Tax=Cylicocyclus nassatus TaxID=53992 RepID=A0AA36H2X6_CYLNA|nr:unnamed protein product [Cylicocyclus nassatus]